MTSSIAFGHPEFAYVIDSKFYRNQLTNSGVRTLALRL